MTIDNVVVVGGGVAAQRCVFALRDLGYERRITMLSAEALPPYDRTLLSKTMITDPGATLAPLRPADSYADRGIELHLRTAATQLDPSNSRVLCSDGRWISYDRLVVATGGKPLVPRMLAEPGVHSLRSASDLAALRASVADASHIAIVGGGFLGGELASSARQLGIDVSLIEAASAPLAPILGDEVGTHLARLHLDNQVELYTRSAATGIERVDRGWHVHLESDKVVLSDCVVVTAGMRPDVGWLEGSELSVDNGIQVDAFGRTPIPGVFAAGDCARWRSQRYGGLIRTEHWETAARHGSNVAANLLGQGSAFDPVPFFWSDQHGRKLAMAGHSTGWQTVQLETADDDVVSATYEREGRDVAVFSSGDLKRVVNARRELAANGHVAV